MGENAKITNGKTDIARLVVSRESVPYNRPVGVRSFVKDAKNRIQCRPIYSCVT